MLDVDVSAWAALELDWADFFRRIARLPALPPGFPPPPHGQVLLELNFERAGSYRLRAVSDFELDEEILIGSLTVGRRVHFEFSTEVPADGLAALLARRTPDISGSVKLGVDIRFPTLPAAGPLRVRAGDSEGWLHIELDVEADTDGTFTLGADFSAEGFELDVLVPGASASEPLLQASLKSIEITMSAGATAEAASVGLRFEGGLTVNPLRVADEVPFADQWRQLFAGLLHPAHIDCALVLEASADAVAADLVLKGAEVELRPFAALAGVTGAVGVTQGRTEIPLEIPLRFVLLGVRVQLASEAAQTEFSLRAMFAVGEVEAEATISVSGRGFSVRIGDVAIPLALPRFPLTKHEFDERHAHPEIIDQLLATTQCPPAGDAIDNPEKATLCKRLRAQRFLLRAFDSIPQAAAAAGRAMDATALGRYHEWLGVLIASLDLATSITGAAGESASFRITQRVLDRLTESGATKTAIRNLKPLLDVRHYGTQVFWDALRARLGARDFGRHSATITKLSQIRGASMSAHIDGTEHVILENLTLVIDHLEVVVPFGSQSSVRADGSIKVTAFSEPLGQLEIELEAGISADMIYFSLKSVDGRVTIPDFGRYTGGSIRFSQFLIGFGYTKRSLALAFAGEVVLPEQLVADLDTSSITILGIRLPVSTRLFFRLDLVPVPAPEIAIIVPVIQFNLDLRRAGLAAMQDPGRCLPVWDGLQLIVRDEFRFALKHIAFSPVFGFLPALNWVLNGDLAVGDDHNGVGIVINEWMQIDAFWTPSSLKIALPGFSDDTPFVDDCCVDVRFAGFGVHFHIQRPFPSVSPLALPELFALFSDPGNYPVNPRGELANSLRITLANTGIQLPSNLLALFPAMRAVAGPPVSTTINLGTFITIAQKLARVVTPLLKEAIKRVRAAADDPQALVRRFTPPRLQPRDILRLLPAHLQRLETQAAFAGFTGRAVVVLMTIAEARDAFRERQLSGTPLAMPHGLTPGASFSDEELLNFQPRLPDDNAARPPAGVALISDPVFSEFTASDLAVSAVSQSGDGVLVGARLVVFSGQSVNFIGFVASDGTFALVASANQPPLTLRVLGIDVPMPFIPDVRARLTLKGHADQNGVTGSLIASGSASWPILPDMIEANIEKASLRIESNGSFALKGDATLALFGGRMTIDGTMDVSAAHAIVSGKLAMDQGPLHLDLGCTGRLGPLHVIRGGQSHAGERMDITAAGKATLFGQKLASVKARVVGERLELEADWQLRKWQLFGTPATLTGDLALRGVVWFPKAAPAMRLEGHGGVGIRWDAKVATPGDVRIDGDTRLESGPEGMTLTASGALEWQGRTWASGTLRATSKGIRLGGHTSFTLLLPPSDEGLIAQLPRLVARLDVQGSFELDGLGIITACDCSAHWLVGAKINAASDQIFTLAAGGARFDSTAALPLVDVHDFQLVPGVNPGGLSATVQVPTPDRDSKSWIKLGNVPGSKDPSVRFSAMIPGETDPRTKTITLVDAGLTFPGPTGPVHLGGPAVPKLSDDDISEVHGFYPFKPVDATGSVNWPSFAHAFKLSLVFSGGTLCLELTGGPRPVVFRLSDGRRL